MSEFYKNHLDTYKLFLPLYNIIVALDTNKPT